MAINRVEIKNFLVFKGEFAADFCPGINVIIGGNATGKTTLLKCLYDLKRPHLQYPGDVYDFDSTGSFVDGLLVVSEPKSVAQERKWGTALLDGVARNLVYIPEKDILEHARGLLTFIEDKKTGFGQIYKDVLIKAMDTQTQSQSSMQKTIVRKIVDTIGGTIHWDKGEGSFYTLRTDGNRIPFASEASGFKKLGFLGLLVASGQLEPGAVLFWDEPENSLNPELVPILVDVLLELSRNGVQIFLATHSEILASYFSVNREKGDVVMFYSLYKDGEHIKADKSDRFDLLVPNNLTLEPVRLYERKLERGLGGNG